MKSILSTSLLAIIISASTLAPSANASNLPAAFHELETNVAKYRSLVKRPFTERQYTNFYKRVHLDNPRIAFGALGASFHRAAFFHGLEKLELANIKRKKVGHSAYAGEDLSREDDYRIAFALTNLVCSTRLDTFLHPHEQAPHLFALIKLIKKFSEDEGVPSLCTHLKIAEYTLSVTHLELLVRQKSQEDGVSFDGKKQRWMKNLWASLKTNEKSSGSLVIPRLMAQLAIDHGFQPNGTRLTAKEKSALLKLDRSSQNPDLNVGAAPAAAAGVAGIATAAHNDTIQGLSASTSWFKLQTQKLDSTLQRDFASGNAFRAQQAADAAQTAAHAAAAQMMATQRIATQQAAQRRAAQTAAARRAGGMGEASRIDRQEAAAAAAPKAGSKRNADASNIAENSSTSDNGMPAAKRARQKGPERVEDITNGGKRRTLSPDVRQHIELQIEHSGIGPWGRSDYANLARHLNIPNVTGQVISKIHLEMQDRAVSEGSFAEVPSDDDD